MESIGSQSILDMIVNIVPSNFVKPFLQADMLLAIMSFVATFILALVAMVCVYCLVVLFFGRLNPLNLIKKHAPTMLTNFSLASSNAAMPFNIS